MPLISGAPQYLSAPHPQDIKYIAPLELPASPLDQIGGALGAGLGKGVYEQLEQSALDRALAKVRPGMSLQEKMGVMQGLSPANREAVQKYGFDPMQQQESASVLGGVLSAAAGLPPVGTPGIAGGRYGETASSPYASDMPMSLDPALFPEAYAARAPEKYEDPEFVARERMTAGGISPEQLSRALAVSSPQQQKMLIDTTQRQQKLQQIAHSEKRKSEEKFSTPFLLKLQEETEGIDLQRAALQSLEDAVTTGDVGSFYQWAVNKLGLDPLTSPDSAQFQSALKEFFMNSLKGAGARPNQWIEQQILSMLPKLGRSEEANRRVIELMKLDLDLKEEKGRFAEEATDYYRENLGYVPAKINSVIKEHMKPFAQNRMDVMGYNLRKIHEETNPNELRRVSKVPQGTPLTLEKFDIFVEKNKGDVEKAVQMAKNAGYKIMSDEFYQRVGQ